MHGDKQDWQKVREKKDTLIAIIPELSVWSKALDEILDHFLSAFDDKVDEKFWSEIYKVSGGSGGPFISGWILALFPYLDKQKKNRYV